MRREKSWKIAGKQRQRKKGKTYPRFHHDSTSRNKAGVFIDRGRRMPSGPPLLKKRRHLTDRAAEQMWLSLQTQGWKPLEEPAWGATADV